MTTTDPTAAKLLKAQAQLQTATARDASIRASIEKQQATFDQLDAQIREDPKLPQKMHIARADAQRSLFGLKNELGSNRAVKDAAQIEVHRLQVWKNKDEELAAARQRWSEASTVEIAAVKAAETARDELARLDTLLAEEVAKTEEAQRSQSAAILARLGFSKKPAGEVAAAESVLIGSAATVDALRTARPDLVAAVAQADAEVARCRTITKQAEQAILNVKRVIAESAALLALEACRACVDEYHAATMAATGQPGTRLSLYVDGGDRVQGFSGDPWRLVQHHAEQLKAQAASGE